MSFKQLQREQLGKSFFKGERLILSQSYYHSKINHLRSRWPQKVALCWNCDQSKGKYYDLQSRNKTHLYTTSDKMAEIVYSVN